LPFPIAQMTLKKMRKKKKGKRGILRGAKEKKCRYNGPGGKTGDGTWKGKKKKKKGKNLLL